MTDRKVTFGRIFWPSLWAALIVSILGLIIWLIVIGAFVILFDPIFQGLAISLMGGTIVSTVLTLLVVPLVYYLIERKNYK